MAWRSLFVFDNPTGLIGSTYEGTIQITSLPINLATATPINLYSFSSLPVGLYSIYITYTLLNTSAVMRSLETGVAVSPTSTTLYPNDFNITSTTTMYIGNNTFSSKLLVKITNANPIYINILPTITSGIIDTGNVTNWFCTATKIA